MPIVASKKISMDPIPEGVYLAVCTRVIDLGDQYSVKFGNTSHKVMICWEIPEITFEKDGMLLPRMISKEYSLSLGNKSILRAHLESWRGRAFSDLELSGFDLRHVLGAACQIQIIHSESGYERVSSIMSIPKGIQKPAPMTDTIYFDLSDINCLDIFEKLPEWVRDKIKTSPQYDQLVAYRSGEIEPSDEFIELDDEDAGQLPF